MDQRVVWYRMSGGQPVMRVEGPGGFTEIVGVTEQRANGVAYALSIPFKVMP